MKDNDPSPFTFGAVGFGLLVLASVFGHYIPWRMVVERVLAIAGI